MKRYITTPAAVKAYRDGEKVQVEFTGFFSHAGNVRTLTERRMFRKGIVYNDCFSDTEFRPCNFTETLFSEYVIVSESTLYGADKIHYQFFTGSDDPERDYYDPYQ